LSAVKTSAAASLPRYLAMTGLATLVAAASRYALKIAQELFPYAARTAPGPGWPWWRARRPAGLDHADRDALPCFREVLAAIARALE
jgi:hypothetical protein